MVKILSPISTVNEVEKVIEAGADELYCGVLSPDWKDAYSVAASPNRRQEDNPTLGTSPHLKSFDDLARCCDIAHVSQRPVSFTLNEHYYIDSQYPLLLEYVEKALTAGVDAFIVGDVGLLLTLRERGIDAKIYVSTAGTTFNAEAVMFYRDLGADRIILPRHLSLEEIETLASKSEGAELEVFILNSRCANIDGFCTFQHGLADLVQDTQAKKNFENACMLLYDISVSVDGQSEVPLDETSHLPVSWERQHLWSGLHIDDRPCGACALYEFEAMGITGVKIAGRQNSTEKKLKDVRFLRDLLDFLRKEKPSQGEFRAVARKRYQEDYRWPCVVFKCYYPSVLTQSDGQ